MPVHDQFLSLTEELNRLKAKDNFRFLRIIEKREKQFAWMGGKKFLNLSSNNYLGLASDHRLQQKFFSQFSQKDGSKDFGLSASSSRLLTGTHSHYSALEATLATRYGREAALVFTSGYHANIGILPSLVGPPDIIFSDRLNHASLLDGIRLSGAKLYRYNHLDYNHLETLLNKHRASARHAVIITESVFSMDGDYADLHRLTALKKKYNSWLYVDEAHAVGVFGKSGLGLCEETQTILQIDFLVGTFGKALAALGAFLVADQVVIDYLINKMRSFIFTTALPPILIHWINFLFVRLPLFQSKRKHLQSLAKQLRQALTALGLKTTGNSQIIPVLIGENEKTIRTAEHLRDNGFLVFAIRPPTVPPGTARLRLSLTAEMCWHDLKSIPKIIKSATTQSNNSEEKA